MTHQEFLEWLRRIERDYPVLAWRVDGLQVWPMIRLNLYGLNFHARSPRYSLGQTAGGYARVAAEAMAAWAQARVRDAANSTPPDDPADALFLASSVGIQPTIGGKRYNTRLAPYVEMLARRGLRTRVWEMSPYADYNIPRYTPSSLIQPRILGWRLRSQIQPGIRLSENLTDWSAFLGEVQSAGLALRYVATERLHRDVFYVRLLARRFARWLRRMNPRIAFVADASAPEQALCIACRALGVPTVEIQHGVQGALHPTYAGWTAVPPEGFAARPRAWWSWDRESADAILEWATQAPLAHTAVVGGDPWRDMWLFGNSDVARRASAEARTRVAPSPGSHHILVTLSSNREILPATVFEAVRQSPPAWRWWFRMHPVNQTTRRTMTEAVLRSIGQDPSRMRWATEVPLYALLPLMNCHVTVGLSTVVREAAALGVPSVACMSEAADFYAPEIAHGLARVALTTTAMISAIETSLALPREQPSARQVDPERALDALLALRVLGDPGAPPA